MLLKEEVLAAGSAWGPFEFSDAHPRIVALTRSLARSMVVAMETGVLAIHELRSATLGADVLGPDGHLRLARAKVASSSAESAQ